jgi:ABC-type multidrug transport system fused ATPase/permease subunit
MRRTPSFSDTTIGRTLVILNREEKIKCALFMFFQFTFNLLDILGVILIGVLVSLSTRANSTNSSVGLVNKLLSFLGIDNISSDNQMIVLMLGTIFLLITKMVGNLVTLYKLNLFISSCSAELSSNLVLKLLSSNLLIVQAKSVQEIMFLLTQGVITMLGVIIRFIAMFGDIAMVFLMVTMLCYVNLSIAIMSIAVFGFIGVILFFASQQRALISGRMQWSLSVRSSEEINEALSSFREIFVRNRQHFYAERVKKTRLGLAKSLGQLNFLPNLNKYLLETSVTLGALLVAAFQFYSGDLNKATTSLGLFLAASTRIAPAFMRLQQNYLDYRGSLGLVKQSLNLIDDLSPVSIRKDTGDFVSSSYPGFDARISLKGVVFKYPEQYSPVLEQIDLELKPNIKYAVIGESGAGKSTLVDIILGILEPNEGTVEISGLSPKQAIEAWPGAIAYVPQTIVITNGTIAENINLGFEGIPNAQKLLDHAIDNTNLSSLITQFKLGLNSPAGDLGNRLSGGQKQRIGIARAMFTQPKLLILDEATSALDNENEEEIASALFNLEGITIVAIAHRLSTILKADEIIYIRHGRIECMGKLEDMRKLIPYLDSQLHRINK